MALSVTWRRKMGNHTKRVKLRVQNTLFGFFLFVHYFANLNSQSVCFISPAGPATNSTCSARRKTTHRWPDISRDWPWAWCVWILTSTQIHIKPGFFLFVCFFIFFMPFRRKKKISLCEWEAKTESSFCKISVYLWTRSFVCFYLGWGFSAYTLCYTGGFMHVQWLTLYTAAIPGIVEKIRSSSDGWTRGILKEVCWGKL